MVQVGRQLLRSTSPIPLLKQGHLEPVAQDPVQSGFEYLQGRRLRSLSGQTVPAFDHSHSKKGGGGGVQIPAGIGVAKVPHEDQGL